MAGDITLADHAIEWAHRGVKVLPLHSPNGNTCSCGIPDCPSPAKHPRTRNGLTDATSDPAQVAAWWDKWPDANIGILTGEQFDVIDLDGGDAIDRWRAWVADVGEPEIVGIALSGRDTGGLHLYSNGGGRKTVPSGKRGLPAGCEIKAAGGYVVAPGSRHMSGKTYQWVSELGEVLGSVPWDTWYDTNIAAQPADTSPPIRVPDSTGQDSSYGQGVLRNACQRLASAPEGARWTTLIEDAASSVARAIAGNAIIDQDGAAIALQSAAAAAGLTRAEIDRIPKILARFVAAPISKPLTGSTTPDEPPTLAPFHPDVDPDRLEQFWTSRDYLATIRAHARATRTSPDAVLACVLARTACEIGPHVVLPPIIGGVGSLNIYVGLVAASSGGKSSAIAATATLHQWRFVTKHLGSGEGLLHHFVTREKVKDDPDAPARWRVVQHTERVPAVVDEIDTLSALGARQGSTLLPALRSMWTGTDFGFGYADPTKALEVRAHTYRLAVIVGIQPGRAEALLDDTDAGTPQRFIWAPTTDPGAPDVRGESPGVLPWRVPTIALTNKGRVELDIDPGAYAQVDQAGLARLRANPDAEDGHKLFSQVKVAALLGLLDGRLGIDAEDWDLAETILARSSHTRAKVEDELKRRKAAELDGRAEAAAKTAIHVDQRTTEAAELRAARTISRHVWKHQLAGGCTRKCMLPSIASKYRQLVDVDSAAGMAVSLRWLVETSRPEDTRTGTDIIATYSPGSEKP